jgi:hypothetical protein
MSGRIRAHLMVGIAQHTKFFPDFALRSLPQGGFVTAGSYLMPCGKVTRADPGTGRVSKRNDSCLLLANQFVGHTAPANLARD